MNLKLWTRELELLTAIIKLENSIKDLIKEVIDYPPEIEDHPEIEDIIKDCSIPSNNCPIDFPAPFPPLSPPEIEVIYFLPPPLSPVELIDNISNLDMGQTVVGRPIEITCYIYNVAIPTIANTNDLVLTRSCDFHRKRIYRQVFYSPSKCFTK